MAMGPVLGVLGSKQPALDRSFQEALLAHGSWANDRLAGHGYLVSGSCPKCHMKGSIWHRLWQCSDEAVVRARLQAASQDTIDLALASRDDPMFSTGWVTLPEVAPDEARDKVFVLQELDGARWVDVEIAGEAPHDFFFEEVFTDGSSSTISWGFLVRSGGGSGPFERWGPLPTSIRAFGPEVAPMLHSAPCSEWSAWLWSQRLGRHISNIFSDCKHVVDCCQQSGWDAVAGSFIHAGFMKASIGRFAGQSWPPTVKVVGHAAEKGVAVPHWLRTGSEQADEATGLGADLHPEPTAKCLRDADRLSRQSAEILRTSSSLSLASL